MQPGKGELLSSFQARRYAKKEHILEGSPTPARLEGAAIAGENLFPLAANLDVIGSKKISSAIDHNGDSGDEIPRGFVTARDPISEKILNAEKAEFAERKREMLF